MIYKDNKKLTKYDIEDYSLKNNDLNEITKQMAKSGGFESVNLIDGITILQKMIAEPQCTKFLSFVGAIISTGVRGIIKDMIKKNMFDCIITTCGALDHDIARAYGAYYSGDFRMDDYSLLNEKIHRLGNVLVPMEDYGPLIEGKVQASLTP